MKLFRVVSAFMLSAVMFGCFQTPTELKIEPSKIDLYDQGGTVNMRVSVLDKKKEPITKAKPVFSSDNDSVAGVDASGKVTAQSSGTTQIKVEYKKLSATIPVNVVIVDVLKLEFATPGIYEAMGPENSLFKLNVIAKNESGNDVDHSILKFNSSDQKIATVSASGELTLLGDGTTTITAMVGKKRATLEIPVTILRPSAIKVDAARFSVAAGETAYLPFTVISTKGTPLVSFPVKVEFEKEGIATANEVGQVTGVARGTTNVTVRAGEASNTLTLQVK